MYLLLQTHLMLDIFHRNIYHLLKEPQIWNFVILLFLPVFNRILLNIVYKVAYKQWMRNLEYPQVIYYHKLTIKVIYQASEEDQMLISYKNFPTLLFWRNMYALF